MNRSPNSAPAKRGDTVVCLKDVTKVYPQGDGTIKAVDKVSLEVAYGELVLISGPSGSGKTTLLSLIGGLTTPTSGEVEVCGMRLGAGRDAAVSAFRASTIGFAFQFSCLLPTLTVLDNVRLPGNFAGRAAADARGDAGRLLEAVGLSSKAGAYPGELSGGEQRRVCLARALVNNPLLLLADEPTGDLDRDSEQEVMQILETSNRTGVAIVMVSHQADPASHAHRRLRMTSGQLVQAQCSVSQLR